MYLEAEDLQSLETDELLTIYLSDSSLSYLAGLTAIERIRHTFRANPWKDKEVYGRYTIHSLDEKFNLLPKLIAEFINAAGKKESFFIERI